MRAMEGKAAYFEEPKTRKSGAERPLTKASFGRHSGRAMVPDDDEKSPPTILTQRFPAALPTKLPDSVSATLEVVRGDDKGAEHKISEVRTILGRDPKADFRLTDQTVSRVH